jgi:hypothetical protein
MVISSVVASRETRGRACRYDWRRRGEVRKSPNHYNDLAETLQKNHGNPSKPVGTRPGRTVAGITLEATHMKRLMDRVRPKLQEGKMGYIFLWLLGVPVPILFLIFLLRGCD